ncbi:MAG: acyltransferase family protein [Hyphomicrobiaceae bacterium]
MLEGKADRLHHLDGLRGVAALVVAFSHFLTCFYPACYFGPVDRASPAWAHFATLPQGSARDLATLVSSTPLFVAVNGSFAVYIFFVLSGYVLAAANRRIGSLAFTAAARYLRLTLPCGAAILLTGLLIGTGAMALPDIAGTVGHGWVAKWYQAPLGWPRIGYEAVAGLYVGGATNINPVLWTMQRELIGSLMIFSVAWSVSGGRRRLLAYAALAALILACGLEPSRYLAFVAGAVLFELKAGEQRIGALAAALMLGTGLLLGGAPFFAPEPGDLYGPLAAPLAHFGEDARLFLWLAGSILVVGTALVSAPVRSFFSLAPCRYLGRISFSLYLLHFPLMASLLARPMSAPASTIPSSSARC